MQKISAHILCFAALLFLCGCAFTFDAFYGENAFDSYYSAEKNMPPYTGTVEVIDTSVPQEKIRQYAAHGYSVIGTAEFEGKKNISRWSAVTAAQKRGASVVIIGMKYLGKKEEKYSYREAIGSYSYTTTQTVKTGKNSYTTYSTPHTETVYANKTGTREVDKYSYSVYFLAGNSYR